MRRPQYTITARAIHHHAAQLCQQQLRIQDHGPKCRAVTLLMLLFYAAAHVTSLAATCGSLSAAPSDSAVRAALLATLPEINELQRRLRRALQGDLPHALRRRRQPLAIDLTLIPYHGEPLEDPSEIYRGQAKDGTSHFHAYATAYVIRKGQRFTVGLVYVRKGAKLAEVVKELLRQAAKTGIRPRYLLLDRGFYQVSVIRYLQAARCPFLMPAPAKGRKADHPKGPSGTRVFHLWKRGGWSQYSLWSSDGQKATVSICVKCRNYRGERKRQGRQALVYAYWGLSPSSGQWVYETYRRRFAIETTYRQLREARIRTCTRNPLLRLLYVGIALILRNVWVWLHWAVLSQPHRGGRRINLNRLPFRVMLTWLQQLIDTLLFPRNAINAQRPMPP
ncbi:MAG TPA: transposase [Candidatus Methylomirabilis sp.]|nr:transposase [Candidatus Methylomirabilis sp.]